MDNTAIIFDERNLHCIEINRNVNEIPNDTLDELLMNHQAYYKFDVLYENGNGDELFYNNMVDHPRLEEFVKADVDHLFRVVTRVHPKVGEKFGEAIMTKICENMGLPADLIEEFLHFANSKKSSRDHITN